MADYPTHDEVDSKITKRLASVAGGIKYRTVIRTSGDITISATNMAPVDSSGAFDLSIPAAAGDIIMIGRNAQANGAANEMDFNVAVLRADGTTIRLLSTTGSIGAWTLRGGNFFGATGFIPCTVAAGDLVNGAIKFQLLAKVGGGTRVLFAGSSGVPLQWWAINHGQST